MMSNKEIAERIADSVWNNTDSNSLEFAIQLFVEHLLFPKDTSSWYYNELYDVILNKLNELDKLKGTISENYVTAKQYDFGE